MKRYFKIFTLLSVMLFALSGLAFADRGGFSDYGSGGDYNQQGRRSYDDIAITYRVHEADRGWTSSHSEGSIAGTVGEARNIEAISIHADSPYNRNIRYRVYCAGLGWSNWVTNGNMAGTTGEARPIRGVQIQLTGSMADNYTVYYQVHVANRGWLDWTYDGNMAGDRQHNIEAIRIQLDPR